MELARRERLQRERALRFEEEQTEFNDQQPIFRERQRLFEEREDLNTAKQNRFERRFNQAKNKYIVKVPLPGLQEFIWSGLGKTLSPTIEDYKIYLRQISTGVADAVDSLARSSEFDEQIS